jgi:hypothetical protein
MDHLDVLNTVDSTGAFRVAGVATTDVSFCSVLFLIWYAKMSMRKLTTKIFDLPLLILDVRLNVYLSSQKLRAVFFLYTR